MKINRNLRTSMKRKVQLLTHEKKHVRLRRSHQLRHRIATQQWRQFLFTHETLLIMKQTYNLQNDRNCSACLSATLSSSNFDKHEVFLICGGICVRGKTALIFVQKMLLWQVRKLIITLSAASLCGNNSGVVQNLFFKFRSTIEWSSYLKNLNPMDQHIINSGGQNLW